MRVTRHVRTRIREPFFPFTASGNAQGSQDMSYLGTYPTAYINSDGDQAYAAIYLPWNFDSLIEMAISFIPVFTLSPMSFRVAAQYARPEHEYMDKTATINYSINTVSIRLQELILPHLFDTEPLEANQYLGIQVYRLAGMNTNAYFIGVRVKHREK